MMMNSYTEQELFDEGTHMSTEYNRITRILLSICQEEDFSIEKRYTVPYKRIIDRKIF